jgi:hypothetical protein
MSENWDPSILDLAIILNPSQPIRLPWMPGLMRLRVEAGSALTIESQPEQKTRESISSDFRLDPDQLPISRRSSDDEGIHPSNPQLGESKKLTNCWRDFVRRRTKLKETRKLKHNITQTFFRGLKDTIKHLENDQEFSLSTKFIGASCRTKADRAALQAFIRRVRPLASEVYQHLSSMLYYENTNTSFCLKERMEVLADNSTVRAYLHYAAYVFYDLDPKRLEEKFNVTYRGHDQLDEVWLNIKAYYVFAMVIDEISINEAKIVQMLAEEGLTARFADAFSVYKASLT